MEIRSLKPHCLVCLWAGVHVNVYVHVCMGIGIRIIKFLCVKAFYMRAGVNVCVYIHVNAHIHTYTYSHMRLYIRVRFLKPACVIWSWTCL